LLLRTFSAGNLAQAKAAAFYLVKYITKDGSDLANCLSIIRAAEQHISHHPSIAADTRH
jgi:hypothetical protein